MGSFLDGEIQESLLRRVAQVVTNSGDLVAGADFSLARHGLRRDGSNYLEIYYTGNAPNSSTVDRFKGIAKPFRQQGIHILLKKCPPLLYVPVPLYFTQEISAPHAAICLLSPEDSIGVKLARMSCVTQTVQGDPRSGRPTPDEYYDLYEIVNRIGSKWLDMMLACNQHVAYHGGVRTNLASLSAGLFSDEFEKFSRNEPGLDEGAFRQALTGLLSGDFSVAKEAERYALAYDKGNASADKLRKQMGKYFTSPDLPFFPSSEASLRQSINLDEFSLGSKGYRASERARFVVATSIRDAIASVGIEEAHPRYETGRLMLQDGLSRYAAWMTSNRSSMNAPPQDLDLADDAARSAKSSVRTTQARPRPR
ncbi:hypothetical protein AB0911_38765 [Streptomyces nigra]|uniref:hypothetical protein n=1 Tax=Streptomyces nigra TaxID=1827580 RepID=UPI003451D349